MSTVDEGHNCLRHGSKKRVCSVSQKQQAILVGLIFKSSQWNIDEDKALCNGTKLHFKSMPLTFSINELELTPSDLNKIITHDQPNVERMELEASVSTLLTDKNTHSVASNNQNLIENPLDTTNSPPSRETHLPASKLVSSNLPNIIPHDQPNVEQIVPEAPVAGSLLGTTTHLMFSNNQSPAENPTHPAALPPTQKTLFSSLDVGQIEPEALIPAALTETTTDPVPSNSQSFTDNCISTDTANSPPAQETHLPTPGSPTCASSYPSTAQIQWNIQDLLPTTQNHQIAILDNHDDPTTMVTNTQILVPPSLLETNTLLSKPVINENCFDPSVYAEHELMDTCVKHPSDMTIKKAIKPQKRKIKTKCWCPNCNADGGNKIRSANGRPLHKCHFPECGQIFSRTNHLKVHLDRHSAKIDFFCAYCNKGFSCKDNLRKHIRTHLNT